MHLQARSERTGSGAGRKTCPGSSGTALSPIPGLHPAPAPTSNHSTHRFDGRFFSEDLDWTGRAAWVFRHSAVAAADDDPSSLLTLLTRGQSLVPLGIGLPLDSLPLEPGQRISLSRGILEAGSIGSFRLAGAGISLTPAFSCLSLDGLREHLSVIDPASCASRAEEGTFPHMLDVRIQARLAEALAELAATLVAQALDATSINRAATTLAGLGPGLTPSGDDILVGFLAEAAVLVPAGFLSRERLALLRTAVLCAPRTTPVAMAMRRHALAGEFPEALSRFVEGLGAPAVSTSQLLALGGQLLRLGARSGSDLMAGAVALARATALKGQPR